jgi:hypothetical protein
VLEAAIKRYRQGRGTYVMFLEEGTACSNILKLNTKGSTLSKHSCMSPQQAHPLLDIRCDWTWVMLWEDGFMFH